MSVLAKDRLVNSGPTVAAMTKISKELYEAALDTLRKNYNYVDVLAECLLSEESLSGPRVVGVLERTRGKGKDRG